MFKSENPGSTETTRAGWGGNLLLAGALALTSVACSNGDKSDPNPTATVVFDDLGGGSSIIQVYHGPQDTVADKKLSGTYRDGDTALAVCRVIGRVVKSHPEEGEEPRSSDQWVQLVGLPVPDAQFATVVYVSNPDDLLVQLPVCKQHRSSGD